MSKFKHIDLRLVNPDFGSPLTGLIIELDHLKKKILHGSTKPIIFFQLKELFHMLESLESARIEGNQTKIADFIETKISQDKHTKKDDIIEINNLEACHRFIENNIDNSKVDRAFVSELHKTVVKNLPTGNTDEGDKTPGIYRTTNVTINKSNHVPPEPIAVTEYMDELFNFVSTPHDPQYQLLKIALAHHRFVWIHPFSNGNGRTVRMLTYAMLIKYGFKVDKGRILNPTAIFCSDRDEYCNHLAQADLGTESNLLSWCQYVLSGIKEEIEKIDKLLNYKFLRTKILRPAIKSALEDKLLTDDEFLILKKAIDKQIIKSTDLDDIFANKSKSTKSRVVRMLIKKNMLKPLKENPRKYAINFNNNYLLRGIFTRLYLEGFAPLN